MSQPFVGEIRMFGGNFAPQGWAFCNGAILSISDNDVLFNLIGTTYGGDGVNTFALPDLRSRIPIHFGAGYVQGQRGGAESVALISANLPSHSHIPQANATAGTQPSPLNNLWAANTTLHNYAPGTPSAVMASTAVGMAGGSLPHENMVPYQVINFIISLFGIFPSQS
jgi:microcystin-dependent protein